MHWWVGKAGVRRVHVISHTLRQVAASALLQKSAGRYSYNVVARRFHVNRGATDAIRERIGAARVRIAREQLARRAAAAAPNTAAHAM